MNLNPANRKVNGMRVEDRIGQYHAHGWCRFPYDPALAAWVEKTLPAARAAVAAPENREWLRYGGTWFAGVNVLPNDETGAVAGGPPLTGAVVDFIRDRLGFGDVGLEPAQVSVCYPGYPRPMAGESAGQHAFRAKRDAAHIDGLLPEGPDRRRHLREYHAYLLGIPMVPFGADAAPFTLWEGSHRFVAAAFRDWFDGVPPDQWGAMDVTDRYQALRREIFDSCPRIEIHAHPGEAYLVHRHALHGMAAWRDEAEAGPDGRCIVYFRPEMADRAAWLYGE